MFEIKESIAIKSTSHHHCYGIFASEDISTDIDVTDIHGHLQPITSAEKDILEANGAAFSVLTIDHHDEHKLAIAEPPRKKNKLSSAQLRYRHLIKKRHPSILAPSPSTSASTSSVSAPSAANRQSHKTNIAHYVVLGSIAFINHACEKHSNVWPCEWFIDDSTNIDNEQGIYQWQKVTVKQNINKGQEIFTSYAEYWEDDTEQLNCSLCPMPTLEAATQTQTPIQLILDPDATLTLPNSPSTPTAIQKKLILTVSPSTADKLFASLA
jgi:hypothetical protein